MNLTGGIVLFATIWFLVFFIALQIGAHTQADTGDVTPGTPAGAPVSVNMKRKVVITTLVTVVLWSIIAAIILTGTVTLRDIDWFNRLGNDAAQG